MTVSEWLDNKEAEGKDVSQIVMPDETIYFKEIRTCSILCPEDHPFSTVEQFGHWYYCRGRDKENGPHTTQPQWWIFTKDKDLAIKKAESHIENG
jgi:hypothetical protein